ncbi:MAG: hypothetical protein DDT27_01330 [Dehalococcoidia bacterium]|nr:hypothetical protein [Chloroflexota bacterium]
MPWAIGDKSNEGVGLTLLYDKVESSAMVFCKALTEELIKKFPISNVTFSEVISRLIFDILQVLQVSGIGELVQVGHFSVRVLPENIANAELKGDRLLFFIAYPISICLKGFSILSLPSITNPSFISSV